MSVTETSQGSSFFKILFYFLHDEKLKRCLEKECLIEERVVQLVYKSDVVSTIF